MEAYTVNEILWKQASGDIFLKLVFINDRDDKWIEFNGLGFSKRPKSEMKMDTYTPLARYGRKDIPAHLALQKLTSDVDVFFAHLSNGDIFQIFTIMSHETNSQHLHIFRSFLPGYRLALDRMNGGEEWGFQEP